MGKITPGVIGSNGKMGQAMMAAVQKDPDFAHCWDIKVSRHKKCSVRKELDFWEDVNYDVIFEFTAPSITLQTARFCAQRHIPLVTGTTGLSQKQMAGLRRYAQKTPIFWSANFCLAVHMIEALLPLLGQVMPGADIAISEQHTRYKEDAPSGTALFFAQKLQEVLGKEVAFNSIRGGDSPGGFNEIRFLQGHEEVSISHRALSNDVYAQGALLAAKWLVKQKPGFYSMQNLLPKF